MPRARAAAVPAADDRDRHAQRSDAERDVRRNAELRWPQGDPSGVRVGAGRSRVPEPLGALRRLDDDPEFDVIVIARGGGRKIRSTCWVSAMSSWCGHGRGFQPRRQRDRPRERSSADRDVADLRASTPTDAREERWSRMSRSRCDRAAAAREDDHATVVAGVSRHRTAGALALTAGTAHAGSDRQRPLARGLSARRSGPRQPSTGVSRRRRGPQRSCGRRCARSTPVRTLSRGYAIAILPGA